MFIRDESTTGRITIFPELVAQSHATVIPVLAGDDPASPN
jgi:hypothetical protein